MASSLTSSRAVGASRTARPPAPRPRPARRRCGAPAAGAARPALGQIRGRGEHLHADAVALHRLHHRPRRDLPERRPGDQHGQLAAHRHPLLDDQRDPASSSRGSAGGPSRPRRRARRSRRVTALSTIGQPCPSPNARRPRPRRPAPSGHRHAQLGEPRASRACPGRSSSASAPGLHGRRRPRRGPRCARRDVLVVEGDHVAALRESCAARRGRCGRRSRRRRPPGRPASSRRRGEHPQRLAERDRGLMGHPGQLPAADHADHGQSGIRAAGGAWAVQGSGIDVTASMVS